MKWLINRWDISKNWQLLYPIIGTLGLVYIALKLALLFELSNTSLIIFLTSLIFIILLVVTLSLFKFLEKRWKVDQRWKVIRIFMVFAVTGSLSIIIAKPIFE
jgi:amino acid transporter